MTRLHGAKTGDTKTPHRQKKLYEKAQAAVYILTLLNCDYNSHKGTSLTPFSVCR